MAPTLPRPVTLAGTFSFYLPTTNVPLIKACAELADGVTVKGPAGPRAVRKLRDRGWDCPVLFDRAGDDPRTSDIEPERWFDEQASAGADRSRGGCPPRPSLIGRDVHRAAAACRPPPVAGRPAPLVRSR